MGNCSTTPAPRDGIIFTSTKKDVTRVEGASKGLQFAVYRIAKNTLSDGMDQDRFSYLLRESKSKRSSDTAAYSPTTQGAFAIGLFDGHGESAKAADFAADYVLKNIFFEHYADEARQRTQVMKHSKHDRKPSIDEMEKLIRAPSVDSVSDLEEISLSDRGSGNAFPLQLFHWHVCIPPEHSALEKTLQWHACQDESIPPLPPPPPLSHLTGPEDWNASWFEADKVSNDFRYAMLPFLRRGEGAKGEKLITQGEEGDEVFFLLEGLVEVYVDDVSVRNEGAGAILGEIAMLRTGRRTATVVCESPTVSFFRLSRYDWEYVIGLDRRFEVIRQIFSSLADDRAGRTALLERLHLGQPLAERSSDDDDATYGQQSPPSLSRPQHFPRPCDANISKAFVDADRIIQRKWENERTGTTATVLILSPMFGPNRAHPRGPDSEVAPLRWEATVGWVGDSRGMLISPNGSHSDITTDHHVSVSDERARIMNAASDEARLSPFKRASTRIGNRKAGKGKKGAEAVFHDTGVSLMTTRSIGDPYGSAAIIPFPEISRPCVPSESVGVMSGSRFIVATDGLWDVMSSSSAAALVQQCESPLEAASKLAENARRRWVTKSRQDDITVIVVDLLPPTYAPGPLTMTSPKRGGGVF